MKQIEKNIHFLIYKLRKLRIANNLTQKEMGNILGVSSQSVSAYENGTVRPDIEVIFRYVDYFQISLADLSSESYIYSKHEPTAVEMDMIIKFRKLPDYTKQAIKALIYQKNLYKDTQLLEEVHLINEQKD